MFARLCCLLALPLVLVSPVAAQPPVVAPPGNGQVQPLPPLDFPGTALPPRPVPSLPTDGCDPGLQGWSIFGPGCAPTAWLVNFDLDIIKVHIKNEIQVNPGIPVVFNYNNLFSPSLDVTVAPRLEVGYRLPDGQGMFLFAYRYLGDSGTATAGTIDARARLSTSTFDFLYETERIRPYGDLYFHVGIGARILSAFYDTRNINVALTQSESSNFFGGGIVGDLDVEYALEAIPGLALYTNLEAAVILGQVRQNFHSNDGVVTESASQRGTQAVPTLTWQAGLSYVPPPLPNLRLRIAYQFEDWFDLGNLHNSHLELIGNGIFLRAEFVF
jgi:hypothetical protein